MLFPKNKNDTEHIFLSPKSILSKYATFFDSCPHPRPEGFDGLQVDWGDKAFVNPPWGHISPWVEKALIQSGKKCEVHMLFPARAKTRVFQDLIFPNADV